MKVSLKSLSKHFQGTKGRKLVKAVDDVTFDIQDGELVGLLGPSGCGKSTTLYMIAGLHPVTSGQVLFGDIDVTEVPPENRGIGLVFQNYALYPHFSVRQNIRFPLENVRPKLTAEQMEELVVRNARIVKIHELLDRKPKELSGGQQQRVAIARALAKQPQVLLLDEPLSNLDARLRLETREEIKRIQRETGVTTIFVTHDQEEAMSISDRIVVMRKGVLMQEGKPQFVYEEPTNLFVAKFLGSPAINIFDGEFKNNKLYLHGETYGTEKNPKYASKGESNILDIVEKAFELAKDDGYYETRAYYYAQLGLDYKEFSNDEVLATEAVDAEVEETIKKENKLVSLKNKLFSKKVKVTPLEKIVIADVAKEDITLKLIYKVLAANGFHSDFDMFEETISTEIVEAKTNRPCKIGVRPESFSLQPTGSPAIEIDVEFVEHIGRDITIVGNVLGQESRIRAIIPAEERHDIEGQKVVKVYPKRYYVFELNGERVR